MSRMFGRIFWFSSGVATGLYIEQTMTMTPNVKKIINKYKEKYGPEIRKQTSDVAGAVLEVIDEVKGKNNQNNSDD